MLKRIYISNFFIRIFFIYLLFLFVESYSNAHLYSNSLFFDKTIEEKSKHIPEKENNIHPSQKEQTINIIAKKKTSSINKNYEEINLQNEMFTSENISDILNQHTGINVNKLGSQGTFSFLSMRGLKPSHTNIYIDGILMNNVYHGLMNLETLSIDMFDSVEIYKSFIPIDLPSSNVSGAVQFRTRKLLNKESELFYNTNLSSLQGGKISIGYQFQNKDKTSQIHIADFSASRNIYNYIDNNGTSYFNTSDDIQRERKNEDYIKLGASSIYNFKWSFFPIKIFTDLLYKENGLSGVLGNPIEFARLRLARIITKVSMKTPFLKTGILKYQFNLMYQNSKLNDPNYELALGIQEQTRDNLNTSFLLMPTFYIHKKIKIISSTGLSLNNLYQDQLKTVDRLESHLSLGIDYLPIKKYIQLSIFSKELFLYDFVKQTKNSFTNNEIYNIQNQKDFLNNTHLRFSFFLHEILYKKNTSSTTLNKNSNQHYIEIFSTIGRSQRYPTVSELFGDGSLLLPSFNLKKEKSFVYETGIKTQFNFSLWQIITHINYFHRKVEDLILLISNSQKTMLAINADNADIQGLEIAFDIKYSHYIQSRFQYTLMKAINESTIPYYNQKYLPYQPKHKLNINLNMGLNLYHLLIDLDYMGANYRDRYNSYFFYLEKRFYVSLSFIIFFNRSKKHQIAFHIKNLLDEQSYDVIGYSLPGRIFEIQAKGRI